MDRTRACGLILVAMLNAGVAPAWAQQGTPADFSAPVFDSALFLFGGRYTDQYFEYSFLPFGVGYEDNYVFGGGYQHFLADGPLGLRFGVEAGLAARFGDGATAEVWGGGVIRHEGWVLGNAVRVSPAVTVGVSAVSGTMNGVERQREAEMAGRADVLFYLAPEINLSLAEHPEFEAFWRIHHRSGGWETLGAMRDGANANTLGFRWRF